MDTLVGIPIVSLVALAVVLVAINLKSAKIIELIPLVAYTGRNSGITPQRLERGSVTLLIQNPLLTR